MKKKRKVDTQQDTVNKQLVEERFRKPRPRADASGIMETRNKPAAEIPENSIFIMKKQPRGRGNFNSTGQLAGKFHFTVIFSTDTRTFFDVQTRV